jgi:hypothetical protein
VITRSPSCLLARNNPHYVNIYHFLEKLYILLQYSFQRSASEKEDRIQPSSPTAVAEAMAGQEATPGQGKQ